LKELSRRILSNFRRSFYPAVSGVKCAMAYTSTQSEAKTAGIINFLLSRGVRVFLPCVRGENITPKRYKKGCRMVKGAFNIKEPAGDNGSCRAESIGLAIVPGVAFDRSGNRIGFGKGFYDRFLKQLPKGAIKAGICFEKQLVKTIPEDKHDVRMDYIITEKEVIRT